MARKTTKSSNDYTADDFSVLEGLDAVRKRPGMYIGSLTDAGLAHMLWEILDNSVDEALAGYANRIKVTCYDDGSFEVSDNGRGIPVDVNEQSGLPGVTLILTTLHAGGKFGGKTYEFSGGLHGVGASVVNALSSRLDVTVQRDGRSWSQHYENGVPGVRGARGFKPSVDLIKGRATKQTGTSTRFWPDSTIFKDATLSKETIAQRCQRTAHLIAGTTIEFEDLRDGTKEQYVSKAGLSGLVASAAEHSSRVCDPIVIEGEGTYAETVQVVGENGDLSQQELQRRCKVELALCWVGSYSSEMHAFVNTVPTPEGGVHVAGFERALVRVANEAMRASRVLKEREPNIVGDDAREGMICALRVFVAEPTFEGQTKTRLGTAAVQSIVYSVVADGLRAWFSGQGLRGARKTQPKKVLTKMAEASRARLKAKELRETRSKTKAVESSLPDKLSDCRTRRVGTELLIVEGDSAAGPCKAARNSEFQAVLPIRGKIINAARTSTKQLLANAEAQALFAAIGGGVGKEFNAERARYERIVIVVDADVDGSHIRCLLLAFFYHWMRPLLEEGRVYAAMPPLYTLFVGKDEIHAYSDAERDDILAKLSKKGQNPRDIQRFKGLGEMDVEQMESVLSPQERTIRRITIDDAAQAAQMFDVCMGQAVEPRKQFIITNSDLVEGSIDV